MEIYRDIEQGTDAWHSLRIGSIGGSSISKAVAGGKGKSKAQLMWDLIGEIISGEKKNGYVSHEMIRGMEQEPDARFEYELRTGHSVEEVGLVKHSEHKHYSPDGLINDDGMIEIKCVIPSVFAEIKVSGKIPTAHRKQMQWGMHICQRQWCDYVIYSEAVKKADNLIIIRIERDNDEIKVLDEGADDFIEEMQTKLISVMKGGE